MKTAEDLRKYAAEQPASEEKALQRGIEQESKELVKSDAEVYTTT